MIVKKKNKNFFLMRITGELSGPPPPPPPGPPPPPPSGRIEQFI